MQHYFYTYKEFVSDTKILVDKIEWEFDAIIAIARGGLSLAQMLGEYYNIRYVYAINTIGYEQEQKLSRVEVFNIPQLKANKNVLIVDDIVDSGDTMIEVLSVLRENYPQITFKTATLFYKPSAKVAPTWYVKEPKGWIDFFWSSAIKNSSLC